MVSRASRQGNAIAGLEASAAPLRRGRWLWNWRRAFWGFAWCGCEGWREVVEDVDSCRIIGFEATLRVVRIRVAATRLRGEFILETNEMDDKVRMLMLRMEEK